MSGIIHDPKEEGERKETTKALSQEASDKMSTKKSNAQINILHLFNIYIYTYTYFSNLKSEMKNKQKKLSPNATAKCLCLH